MTPDKGTIAYGAWNGLKNGLKVKEGERIFIMTDHDRREIAEAFSEQGKLLSGVDPVVLFMEDFGRPLTHMPKEVSEELKRADVTVLVVGGQPGELGFRTPFHRRATRGGARHAHGIGLNKEIMLSGMQTDIEESDRLCREVFRRLNGIEWMRVTSSAGTDILLEFRKDIKWIESGWDFEGKWHNIPSGEVFTWPANANGKYVVDGVLGDHFDEEYGSLKDTPVTYVVKDNKIISIDCPLNPKLEKELRKYVFETNNGDILGEVGVGTLRVGKLVNQMLQDEKLLGTVHIAHGSNYSGETGAPDLQQTTHCDGIILDATIETSREEFILKNGEYIPSA